MKAAAKDNAKEGAFKRLGLTPNQCRFARARQRGWNDKSKGLEFRDAYDTWDRREQWAYERGRFQATLAAQQADPKAAKAFNGRSCSWWRDDEPLINFYRGYAGPLLRTVGTVVKAQAIHAMTRDALRRPKKLNRKGKKGRKS